MVKFSSGLLALATCNFKKYFKQLLAMWESKNRHNQRFHRNLVQPLKSCEKIQTMSSFKNKAAKVFKKKT